MINLVPCNVRSVCDGSGGQAGGPSINAGLLRIHSLLLHHLSSQIILQSPTSRAAPFIAQAAPNVYAPVLVSGVIIANGEYVQLSTAVPFSTNVVDVDGVSASPGTKLGTNV